MLQQLLWKNKSKWQIAAATLGAVIGLLLLLAAVQFYADLTQLLGGKSGKEEFVQVNKQVNFFNTLGVKNTFTEEEIAELEAQPFIQQVGQFTSNQFKVGARSELLGFYTELFFESVPEAFVDVKDPRFSWSEGDREVPIILSRDYLALYNFGFAPSQGLPQFTPGTIQKVSMDLVLRDDAGRRATYTGRIVGFSDRINSILVPESFMTSLNARMGSATKKAASRLILQVDNPLAKDFRAFLTEKGYEVSSGRLLGGQFGTLLEMAVGILALFGVVIVGLSLLVFLLNFQLFISQSAADIRLLLQLGYKTDQIIKVLFRNLAILFGGVLLVSLLLLYLSRGYLVSTFAEQGFQLQPGLHVGVWLAALLFAGIFFALNYTNIRRHVHQLLT